VVASGSRRWERYAWGTGVLFVAALVAETVVATGINLSQNDSAAKIASGLQAHHQRLILIACLSILLTPAFVVYLSQLHELLREHAVGSRFLLTWVLIGGVLFVTLHGVSDIGITGLLGAKVGLASYSGSHDPGVSYSLYLLTFALDSVGDVFASLFMAATGLLVLRSTVLPRWLGWAAIIAAPCFFAQTFGLGGVIASFGLVLDLIGFLLLLIFVLVSSLILMRRTDTLRVS